MHSLEPHYSWLSLYEASSDPLSPFYDNKYSEFEFTYTVYNYVIHPQWECFGSNTLYMKLLFVDYDANYCIIELIGEWNDCLHNDVMYLKRNVVEVLEQNGINKFILIGENVLNFHYSDDCYYQEWFDDIEDGWIACLNFRKHVLEEFEKIHIDYYMAMGGELNTFTWRPLSPAQIFERVDSLITKRLN
ncbi:MAG: hypothetical protein HXX09_08170 [Bacteroidetes bacterium]|nr:hypothetical protein [Bacteroidota bacterium]